MRILILLCLTFCATTSFAADAPPVSKCSAPEHRQFDFWIGNWTVTEKGKPAGENRIESIDNGCVLLESWKGVGGLTGHSVNIYDAKRGVWHQTWVDSSGSLLTLEGTFKDGAMILQGDHPGTTRRERITWTKLRDGNVRQHWETSQDSGATWTTAFDGLYSSSSR